MDELRRRVQLDPFEPFTVVTGDGTRVDVMSPTDAWVSPGSGLVYIQRSPIGFHTFGRTEIAAIEDWVPPTQRSAG